MPELVTVYDLRRTEGNGERGLYCETQPVEIENKHGILNAYSPLSSESHTGAVFHALSGGPLGPAPFPPSHFPAGEKDK